MTDEKRLIRLERDWKNGILKIAATQKVVPPSSIEQIFEPVVFIINKDANEEDKLKMLHSVANYPPHHTINAYLIGDIRVESEMPSSLNSKTSNPRYVAASFFKIDECDINEAYRELSIREQNLDDFRRTLCEF